MERAVREPLADDYKLLFCVDYFRREAITMGFGDSLLNSAGLDLYCISRLTLFESFNFFSSPKV